LPLVGPCTPGLGFAGGKFIVTYCPPVLVDGGVSTSNVATVDPVMGTTMDIKVGGASNVFSTDKAGTKILIVGDAGDLIVMPLAGGTATTIDTNVAYGFITDDGMSAIYRTNPGAVKTSPVVNPTPVTLVATGAQALLAASKDFKWIVYATTNGTVGGTSDLFMIGTGGGTPVDLTGGKTDGAIYGDPFTADNSRVVYYTGVNSDQVGTLNTKPVSGGTGSALGTNVWSSLSPSLAKVVFSANYVPDPAMMKNGRGDLQVVDSASATATPTEIAAQADVDYFLSHARDRIVYTTEAWAGQEGLYVVPVP
jgi:hypothetical protein